MPRSNGHGHGHVLCWWNSKFEALFWREESWNIKFDALFWREESKYAQVCTYRYVPVANESGRRRFRKCVGSVRRSTARQIVSKLIEFVCPSSTRHRSAGSVRRSTARQIVSKLIEFVCPSSADCFKIDRIRPSFRRLTARH
jgi:hypothetical protein